MKTDWEAAISRYASQTKHLVSDLSASLDKPVIDNAAALRLHRALLKGVEGLEELGRELRRREAEPRLVGAASDLVFIWRKLAQLTEARVFDMRHGTNIANDNIKENRDTHEV